ncbi:MAG: gamma-glutamyltransferase family protein [Alphaproteobacteria bacterium]|nr:gamma-glutamyltransferase family protein [Alphaproteobacteria bacterium]MDE1985277.1 gamma-glutamyltransferase family protein [Alphaproteobacteria bacterium]MDE2265358.1 gamma-glutamyltransferase family protein [Alphaproteobacteria bacterium]MDE2498624.1 gamma-glutamyltransferase family protein [Alphaproteobacteria bacterium]
MVLMAVTATSATGQISRGDRYSGVPWATRSPVLAQHGMAATEQPLATQIAVDILKKGGSAVDAAIAANAAIGLMQPVLNGIGGDCFAIVYDPKTHKLYGYNGSGRAPMGRDLAKLKAEIEAAYKKAGMPYKAHIPPVGSLPVTVPGTVDAWFALHDKFGKLTIKEDLAPAIAYATNGVPVTELISLYWKENMAAFEKRRALIEEFDNAKHTYLIPDADGGHTPTQGEIFKNPDLAHTLTMIADGGRDVFYKGAIAHTMDAYFKRIGGDLRYADFAAHHGEWVEPQSVAYRGYDVYELPPNGQGFAVLEMLQILKHFDLKKMGVGSADALTAMLEAKRLAFEDLAKFYADPAFVKVPMKGLISAAYGAQRAKEINLQHANPNIGPGDPQLFNGDTIYLTTADKDGMMVSLIQSNYRGMGSGLVADHLGFMFQDRGELFSLDPHAANVYAPGKRPFHTIIPGFVMKDGQPFMSFGLMGGDMQPQGHVQVLTDIIDFGMNVQEAGDAARWRHYGNAEPTGEPSQGIGTVEMESGFSPTVKAELEKRGYKVVPGTGAFGGYQAIMWDAKNRVYWGASEMRKDGEAMGY